MRVSNYMVAASAAALLLTGSAFAQSPNADKGGAAGGAMQKSEPAAPASGGAMNKGAAEPGAKAPGGMKASEGMKAPEAGKAAEGAKAPETNKMSQDNKAPAGASKSAAENNKPNAGSSTTASDSKSGADMNNRTATDQKGADSKNTAQGNTKSTVGSTSDSVKLSSEQKTTLRQKVLVSGAPRVDHVDFAVNIGTRVPTSVRVVEVPDTLIEIHPQWRGFRYFVVADQIIVVDPNTLQIVAVLDV